MWNWLSFLAEPWFVIPWYLVGAAGAAWVAWDVMQVNTQVNKAVKGAFPIIVFFFSVIGIAVYLWSARPPDIGKKSGEEEKEAFHAYATKSMLRKVTGSVIHCVGGDGMGIMTAMVVARLVGLSFWQEFWFEYAVGFLFGWFIFQYLSFRYMDDASRPEAYFKAFRGEFPSMVTVMLGMGVVMRLVTPHVVGMQPSPWTYGFWGFGSLGLLVGFVLTYPTNAWLVKIGWKHGLM